MTIWFFLTCLQGEALLRPQNGRPRYSSFYSPHSFLFIFLLKGLSNNRIRSWFVSLRTIYPYSFGKVVFMFASETKEYLSLNRNDYLMYRFYIHFVSHFVQLLDQGFQHHSVRFLNIYIGNLGFHSN